jgi:hypothetical protein
MVGILYMDSGFLSVILGMSVLGVMLRTLWTYFQMHKSSLGAQLLYVMCMPAIVVLMRDSPGQVLGELVFTVGPVVCILLVSGRDGGGEQRHDR